MKQIKAQWVTQSETQDICAMLVNAGFQAYFVGGCVRNALLGAPISDIDLATDALPEQVVGLAKRAGFKPVPTGVEHGTVTVVVRGHAFEITTYRKDIDTDGRRATVSFSKSIEEDAHRRDFTMNALFATPDGTIVDPLGGLNDLLARRVRFIDDPGARIREDYLRILRFFRFHAWYGDLDRGLDREGLAAVAAHCDGIETLSRERVGQEMKKLLGAADPAASVAAMEHAGVLAHVLPGATSRILPVLIHFEHETGARPDSIVRLASLGGCEQKERLRLSRSEARNLSVLQAHAGTSCGLAELAYRHGPDMALGIMLLNCAMLETNPPSNFKDDIAMGVSAKFPVSARDLMPDLKGKALGGRLDELEKKWIASGFTLTREELLK